MLDLDRAATILNAAPFVLNCAPPFLAVRFFEPYRTLGWSLLHPGIVTISDVVWVKVRDHAPEIDPRAFLQIKLAEPASPTLSLS